MQQVQHTAALLRPAPLSTQLMPRPGSPRRRWQAAEYILSEHVERHTPRSARYCGGEQEATPALKTLPFPASKSFWDCAELLLERGVCVVDGQALVVEGSGADAQAEQVLALGAQVCHAAHAGAQQHLRGSHSHTTRCMYALIGGGIHCTAASWAYPSRPLFSSKPPSLFCCPRPTNSRAQTRRNLCAGRR